MREVLRFPARAVLPGREAVLRGRDMPPRLEPRHEALLDSALELLEAEAVPAGVVQDVSGDEFARVFEGEGRNETPNPLGGIFPKASALALFAATLGPGVSRRVEALFEARDFALGYMLDAAASAAADAAAGLMQKAALSRWSAEGKTVPSAVALRYSPGYCGWHISAQSRLFETLRPVEAGISLGKSFLMEPLKSVSGVVVCGAPEIHAFDDDFEFCGRCGHRSCRGRVPDVPERAPGCEA